MSGPGGLAGTAQEASPALPPPHRVPWGRVLRVLARGAQPPWALQSSLAPCGRGRARGG